MADYGNKRVRWIAPDGIIQTVAGNGSCCYSGDGGPATAAGIGTPTGIALAADGTLYIAEPFEDRKSVV